ncbi:MAG: FkbM family methyltransferase [Bryobacterales bacterium]|nr:FkbM family methyltransferase [Bryobacterales bacterium]MBV9400155.1 FkbM family methyltransferase [Bryobacterales bacterium]
MRFVKRYWIVVLVLFALVFVEAWRYRKLVVYGAFITFTNSNCKLMDVLSAKANSVTGNDVEAELKRNSRRIRTDPDGFELWDTPDGEYWDLKSSTVLSVLSEQARNIYTNRPDQSIRPGDIVFDCGASIGVFTRKALKAGAKKVIAVEPGPESLVCLRRNYEKEIQNGTVVVIPKGVYDHEGEMPFLDIQDNPMGSRFIRDPRSRLTPKLTSLPITTIDKIVADLGLPSVDFIKMDIEGSERYALKGAEQTLRKFHPRMAICTYHLRDDPKAIPAVVEAIGAGYKMQCGACSITTISGGHFRPAVMFFN